MSEDLIKRLRDSADACEYTVRSKLLNEAADEMERLRAATIEECARIVESPIDGITIHTFRFNGELAVTPDGESEFVTRKDANKVVHAKAAALRVRAAVEAKPAE